MGGGASKAKTAPAPSPPPPAVPVQKAPKAEAPKPKPPAEDPPERKSTVGGSGDAGAEGIFGSARELNTLLLGGENSIYQHSFTVEMDRRAFITYLTEPRSFYMPNVYKDGESDSEEEESAFQRPLDPRDALLKQPHQPPGRQKLQQMQIKGAVAAVKNKGRSKKKEKKRPVKGWRQTAQRVTFKPDSALLPGGEFYLGEDGKFTKSYEPWGIEFDIGKFPLQVKKITTGSVADEHAARHPEDLIEAGDLLVEINDIPVCPDSTLLHQRRRMKMSAKEIKQEEDLLKMSEAKLKAREEQAVARKVQTSTITDADGNAVDAAAENGEENKDGEETNANGETTNSQQLEVVTPEQKRRSSIAGIVGDSIAWHGYDLSCVSRMGGPAGNRFGYRHKEGDVVKPVDNLAFEAEELYTRLDVINKELFDQYYHAPTIKLRFVRMEQPQIDEGLGFCYTLNLARQRQRAGMQKTPWGIVFHLDWEEIPKEELMAETWYTNTSGTSFTTHTESASVFESDEEEEGGGGYRGGGDDYREEDLKMKTTSDTAFSEVQKEGQHNRSSPRFSTSRNVVASSGSSAKQAQFSIRNGGRRGQQLMLENQHYFDEGMHNSVAPGTPPSSNSEYASSVCSSTPQMTDLTGDEPQILGGHVEPLALPISGTSKASSSSSWRHRDVSPPRQAWGSSSSLGSRRGQQTGRYWRRGNKSAVEGRHQSMQPQRGVYDDDEEEPSDVDPEPGMPPEGHYPYPPLTGSSAYGMEEEEEEGGRRRRRTRSQSRSTTNVQSSSTLSAQQPGSSSGQSLSRSRAPREESSLLEEVDTLGNTLDVTAPLTATSMDIEDDGLGERDLRPSMALEEEEEEEMVLSRRAAGQRGEYLEEKGGELDPSLATPPEVTQMSAWMTKEKQIAATEAAGPRADEFYSRAALENLGFGRNMRMRRVVKVHSIENGTVASTWNEDDPDMSILPGDKLVSVQGIDVSKIAWDFLLLPPYPDEEEVLAGIEEESQQTVQAGDDSTLLPARPSQERFQKRMEHWKNEVMERFREHKVLSAIFELVIESYQEPEYVTQYGRTAAVMRRKFRTYLKCKQNYFPRDLELELEFYRYDPDAAARKAKTGLRSPRRVLNFMQTSEGMPLTKTQSPQSPMHRPSPPGSPDAKKEDALREMEEEVYNYEAPPALEVPNSLAKSRFRVFLNRASVHVPWGIYLDERFATLNVYIVQELEGAAEAPVSVWNEYVQDVGAFGCQLQTGDLVVAFNEKNTWHEAEQEIQHALKLVLECYRPPYKPCAMTSPPFLQTNEKCLDICWARSRFLTTVYDDEEALANTPDGGLRDTHYCVVLHSLSPDRWYVVDGVTREAKDISQVANAIPAPIQSIAVVNLPSLRSYEAYVAIRNSQG
ncbi:unnamed protein product, partial [Amoebophrya sp. A25]|eukprot:GSA25T00005685001.1